jgi:uncharacterized protein YegJ (DUF2314 family)
MEMNPAKEKCVNLAEHYDIDWYTGEFASVFWNQHNTDEFNLEQLQLVHDDCCNSNQGWGNARSKIIAKLEELQGRSPSVAGDPSWLRNQDGGSTPITQAENVAWLPADDAEMAAAIRNAQRSFIDFAKMLDSIEPQESLAKAFFAHPANPMVGEHIYIDTPSISGNTIQGEVWFESTGIPGLKSGQRRSTDITRLSDWYYVVDGTSHGGYTLPVLAARMDDDELNAAREYPPFKWFKGKL